MAQLSEWLELMLAEIARRQEEAQLNAEEEARRLQESHACANGTPALHTTLNAADAVSTTASSEL